MPSTFRIPKATVTGLYGKALSAYARGRQAQGHSDVCEVPLPDLSHLHAAPAVRSVS